MVNPDFLGDFVIRVKRAETLPDAYRAELWMRPEGTQEARFISLCEHAEWLTVMINARGDMPMTPHKIEEALAPRSMEDITS